LQRGKNKEAVERFLLATATDSTSLDASYGLAWALARLGKFEDADQVTMKIKAELERRNLTASQAMVGFHLMRARVLTEERSWEEAKASCDDALEFSTPIRAVLSSGNWLRFFSGQANMKVHSHPVRRHSLSIGTHHRLC
jgi:hypothetical protein